MEAQETLWTADRHGRMRPGGLTGCRLWTAAKVGRDCPEALGGGGIECPFLDAVRVLREVGVVRDGVGLLRIVKVMASGVSELRGDGRDDGGGGALLDRFVREDSGGLGRIERLPVVSNAYDPAGRLASTTDAMGATTSYTYYDDGLAATTTAQQVTQTDGVPSPARLLEPPS